jgi:hypothetical protein
MTMTIRPVSTREFIGLSETNTIGYYAQVVKSRNKVGQVVEVRRRVVCGGPRCFVKQVRLQQLGETIQTAFMERWYGTLRGLVAPLRRRTRCLSWSRTRHRGKVWVMVSLYNFVMPHKSLRQGRTRRTPAMAIGLTDHVWSYREYIWLPVHTDSDLTKQMDERMAKLLTPALQEQPGSRTHAPTHERKRKRQLLCQKLREGPVIVLQDYPIVVTRPNFVPATSEASVRRSGQTAEPGGAPHAYGRLSSLPSLALIAG